MIGSIQSEILLKIRWQPRQLLLNARRDRLVCHLERNLIPSDALAKRGLQIVRIDFDDAPRIVDVGKCHEIGQGLRSNLSRAASFGEARYDFHKVIISPIRVIERIEHIIARPISDNSNILFLVEVTCQQGDQRPRAGAKVQIQRFAAELVRCSASGDRDFPKRPLGYT